MEIDDEGVKVPGPFTTLPYRSKVHAQATDTQDLTESKTPRVAKPPQVKNISVLEKKAGSKSFKAGESGAALDGEHQSKLAASKISDSTALPDFILQRNQLFDELKQKADAELLQKERLQINVVLDLSLDKDGKPRPRMPVAAKAWESTPGSFLKHVHKDISADVVIAKVDGKELWDLDRPLEYACHVSYLPFSSAEGRNVFWHSSAHVLGEAAECHYKCRLSHGPPVEQGFFYDMALDEG